MVDAVGPVHQVTARVLGCLGEDPALIAV
jgi:hypothetical protein